MTILKDRKGNPQGVIREVAGGMQRLLDLGGKVVATYRPDTDSTYDKNGVRIGTGNRLAGPWSETKIKLASWSVCRSSSAKPSAKPCRETPSMIFQTAAFPRLFSPCFRQYAEQLAPFRKELLPKIEKNNSTLKFRCACPLRDLG
jgi:hypothetical protein